MVIMKRNAYRTILAIIAMLVFGAMAAVAQTQYQPEQGDEKASAPSSRKVPAQRHQAISDMNMAGVTYEPHQVLAKAYTQNIGIFAKALRDSAQGVGSLSADFARVAVEEMKRNFDEAEEHHREHVKTLSADIRSKTAARMKQSEIYRSRLKDAIATIEKDVLDYTLNSKRIATDSADVIKHLDEILKLHGGNNDISPDIIVSVMRSPMLPLN